MTTLNNKSSHTALFSTFFCLLSLHLAGIATRTVDEHVVEADIVGIVSHTAAQIAVKVVQHSYIVKRIDVPFSQIALHLTCNEVDVSVALRAFWNVLNMTEGTLNQQSVVAEMDVALRIRHARRLLRKIVFLDNPKLKPIVIDVANSKCDCRVADEEGCDVVLSADQRTLEDILGGRMTFQRGFMAGSVKMKGDFKLLRSLDQLFDLMSE